MQAVPQLWFGPNRPNLIAIAPAAMLSSILEEMEQIHERDIRESCQGVATCLKITESWKVLKPGDFAHQSDPHRPYNISGPIMGS